MIRDHNGSAFAIELADVHDPVNRDIARKASGQYERLNGEEGEHHDEGQDLEALETKSIAERRGSLRETVQDYVDRLSDLLQSKLRRVTLLTWSLWFTASAAYTSVDVIRSIWMQELTSVDSIFNVFMPKFLEEKLGSKATPAGRVESLQEYCLYTFSGYVVIHALSQHSSATHPM